MNFIDWFENLKMENPKEETFLNKLQPYFGEGGFNSAAFEKAVKIGSDKIDSEVRNLLESDGHENK